MSAASTDTKNQTQAANIITIRLPASCPLFRYTLNKEFGSTASHSLPAGFQVPSVSSATSQQSGAGAAALTGATGGQADLVQQAPVQQGSGGQSGAGQSGQQQPAPGTGGDLPTHTSGQAPPPTDQPSPQRKRQEQQYHRRQNPSGQGADAGSIPVVREGEQTPLPASPDQDQDQGLAGGASPNLPVAAPVTVPSTGQAVSPQNPPNIPKGADSGWLGVNQASAQNSSTVTAKQLQGQVGQIQVLPFPITSFTPLYTDSPYQLTLSGLQQTQYPWKSGVAYTQAFGPGWLTMDVTCPTTCQADTFAFIGADVTTEACPPGVQLQSVSADDADKVITYAGFAPIKKDNRVVEVRGDYKNTLSMTATANATASFKFRAVMVKGVTAPKLGDYCVTVDGTATYLTSQDDIETHAVPLYFMTSLDDRQVHEVQVTSLTGAGGQTGLVLDQVNLWGPAGQTGFIGPGGGLIVPSTDTAVGGVPIAEKPTGGGGGTSAGVIVGAVLGTLAAIALCWYLLNKYNKVAEAKKEAKKMDPWDEANLLSNQKNEGVYVTTVANQRYVYPGRIAHSELK